MTSHKCEVTTCTVRVPHETLMCLTHWRKVTKQTKREVYRARTAWRQGRLAPGMYQAVIDLAKKEAVA